MDDHNPEMLFHVKCAGRMLLGDDAEIFASNRGSWVINFSYFELVRAWHQFVSDPFSRIPEMRRVDENIQANIRGFVREFVLEAGRGFPEWKPRLVDDADYRADFVARLEMELKRRSSGDLN